MQEDKRYVEAEEFELSLKAYLNYVSRKMRKHENYDPYPLVKAIALAVQGARDEGKPGTYAGTSGDANQHYDGESRKTFFCVIELNKDESITLREIYDIQNQSPVPIKVASYMLLLSLKFDKIEGSSISVDDAIKIINTTIPRLNLIRFNNDEWKEARDYLSANLDTFNVPRELYNDYKSDFSKLRFETPWEEYPPRIRLAVATTWMQQKHNDLFKEGYINITNVYLAEEYPKVTILNATFTMLYGQISDYFDEVNDWNYFSDLHLENNKNVKRTKIKRNQPCPCKSGKKYKHCCGVVN